MWKCSRKSLQSVHTAIQKRAYAILFDPMSNKNKDRSRHEPRQRRRVSTMRHVFGLPAGTGVRRAGRRPRPSTRTRPARPTKLPWSRWAFHTTHVNGFRKLIPTYMPIKDTACKKIYVSNLYSGWIWKMRGVFVSRIKLLFILVFPLEKYKKCLCWMLVWPTLPHIPTYVFK